MTTSASAFSKIGPVDLPLFALGPPISIQFVREGTDVIRFLPNKHLLKKIAPLVPGLQLYQSPYSFEAPYEQYEIPATQCRPLIKAVLAVQKDMCCTAPSRIFHRTLRSLSEAGYITEEERNFFQSQVAIRMTMEEYEEDAETTLDEHKAINLAYFYSFQHSDAEALWWLQKATGFLESKQRASSVLPTQKVLFSDIVNLDQFWKRFDRITTLIPFQPGMEDFARSAALSATIKTIAIPSWASYNQDICERLGAFLRETTSVETVSISSTWSNCEKVLPENAFTPIAEALRVNISIRDLNVGFQRIGDESLIKILQAINENSASKIEYLDFTACGITDTSARPLLELLKRKPNLVVDISSNSRISDQLKREISNIVRQRVREDEAAPTASHKM